MKKFFASFLPLLCLTLLLSTTATAAYTPSSTEDDSSTLSMTLQNNKKTTNPSTFSSVTSHEVGQKYVFDEDDEGNIYYIVVSESTEAPAGRSTTGTSKTTYKTIDIMHKNILGMDVKDITVDLTCSWTSDGTNSSIQNLHGQYTIHNNKYSCVWTNEYKMAEFDYHRLSLEVDNGKNTYVFAPCAYLFWSETPPWVLIDYLIYE